MAGSHGFPLSILFTHFGEPWIRGSEQVLIDLVTKLDPDQFHPVVWCNCAPLAERLQDAGVTVYRSDFNAFFCHGSPRFNAARYLSFVAEGLRLVRRHDVRLLHSNGAAPHQWLLPVARRAGLPTVAHLHAIYLRRERFVTFLHQATTIVGVSRSVITDFLTDGFAAGRARVIHNGIDFEKFRAVPGASFRERLGISPEAILIAAVGSLIPRKGMDLLLEALARARMPELHLAIAGDGPERERLGGLAETLNLTRQVHFLGYCPDVSPLYAASDIAALASRSEAFGLALAEASLFSLPVVSHNLGGIAEVVENGGSGILVSPGDVAAFAAQLKFLALNRPERSRMGAKGNARTRQFFSQERMVSNFQNLYLGLIQQRPTFPGPQFLNPYPYLRLLRSS